MPGGRVLRGEILDRLEPGPEADASLRDLVSINRYLGGHRILRSVFRTLERPEARFTVVDAGAGSGDMGAALREAFPNALVVSTDRIPSHLARAPRPRIAADAFALPFAPRSFDYAMCCLFLHHLRDDEVAPVMAALLRLARRALVVIDLERTLGGRMLARLVGTVLRWSPITRHDALRSIESAFKPDELIAFARQAGASDVKLRKHPPWLRLSMVARR